MEPARTKQFVRADWVGEVAVGVLLPETMVGRFVGSTIAAQYELLMNSNEPIGKHALPAMGGLPGLNHASVLRTPEVRDATAYD